MLKLRLLTGHRAGRQLRVSDTKPISIGRRKGRLRLHDSRVSKNHAEIYFANGLWVLRDLGSANGTYVNRNKAEGLVELEQGDLVQMGRVLFKIVRCDGIGMDMPTGLAGNPLDAAVPGIGSDAPGPGLDDDLQQDDIDGASSDEVLSDDPGVLPGVSESETPANPTAPVDVIDKALGLDSGQAAPEPIEVALDTPVDDDDSFFEDLGEATDATDGADVAVTDKDIEEQEVQGQGQDPFSNQPEGEPQADRDEDTSDHISLEDESGMGPPSAGTTHLSAVAHDDLAGDAGEQSDAQAVASDPLDDADADDEEAPALVGLHLEHAPPQQPEAIELIELDEQAIAQPEQTLEEEADVPADEPDQEMVQEPVDGVAEQLVKSASDDPIGEAEESGQLQASAELTEVPDDPVMADLLAELTDDATEREAEREPEREAEAEAGDEREQAQPMAQREADLDEKPQADDDTPRFDIDAAFDALSDGLGDSAAMPAIHSQDESQDESQHEQGEEDTPAEPETPQPIEPAAATQDAPDPLAGSQLDVGFIKDALAQLEGDRPEQQTDDTPPKAATAPPTTQPPDAPTKPPTDTYLQSTPPGLNPTTILPPVQPDATRLTVRGGSKSGMWFLTLLLLLIAVGGGGILIGQNFDRFIAGRNADNPNTPDPSTPNTPSNTSNSNNSITTNNNSNTSSNNNTNTSSNTTTNNNTTSNNNNTNNNTAPPDDDTTTAPTSPGSPDPFADGPGVIGSGVLDGLTRNSDDPSPLNPVRQPNNTNPTQPDPIRQPTEPNTTNPNTKTPQAGVPGTDTPDTPDPAITTTDQPPARIVFLVDASGSLVDSLPQMLVWLREALQTIEPNEQFAIYFFKDGKPTAIKPEGLVSPKPDILTHIQDNWLDPSATPILASGRSNPTQAIAQAMSLNPTDLYILSDDAFAKHKGNTTAKQAIDLVQQSIGDADTRVHGVQFFYRNDQSILETLTNQYDGTFEFVSENIVPDSEPIDLLKELDDEG